MKHMTSYVFNNDIKTIDDVVTCINRSKGATITMSVQVSRDGNTKTFITMYRPSDIASYSYEVVKLDDLLKIICDDLSLLNVCVGHGIVVPR